jgi:hypothetical protein
MELAHHAAHLFGAGLRTFLLEYLQCLHECSSCGGPIAATVLDIANADQRGT